MSETKFMSGPWEVRKGDEIFPNYWVHSLAEEAKYLDDGTLWIRTFVANAGPNKANANLIAAAPDLYWALDLVKQMLAVNEIDLPHTIAVINEALAKARGEV